MKILLVDDDKFFQKFYSLKLKEQGIEMDIASDGEEGFAKAGQFMPDLILLDLIMPKMGGLEMAKKLRENEWGKDVKIIVLTNVSGDMGKVSESMDDEIFDYFVKSDIKIEDIVAKVKERLETPHRIY